MNKQFSYLILIGLLVGMISSCQNPSQIKPGMSPISLIQLKTANRHVALGNAYYQQGRQDEAVQEWQIALAINREDKQLQEKIDKVKSKQAEISEQKQLITSHSDNSYAGRRIDIELRKAEKYYRLSKLKEAKIAWSVVLTLNPEHADAKSGLEKIVRQLYRYDQKRSFDTMIAELYQNGMAAYRKQNWEKAKMKLLEAEKLAPDHEQIKYYIGIINNKIIQLASFSKVQAQIQEAERAYQQGSWNKARLLYEAILEQDQDHQEAKQSLELCQSEIKKWIAKNTQYAYDALKQDNYKVAKKIFNQILALDSEHQLARQGLQQAKKSIEQTNQKLATVIAAENKFNQGVTHYRAGRLSHAMEQWQQASALDPNNTMYQQWVEKGRQALMVEQESKRKQADSRYADGLAAYQRGEIEDALTAWKESLLLNPNHHKANDNIKRIEKELQ